MTLLFYLMINHIFIEINSFGKEYTSGSSLFHWLIDENKLYSDSEEIYFRYTI